MNKAGLIEIIAQKIGISKKEAEQTIDWLTEAITDQLKQGNEVTLTGFGAFSARTRKGRIGVNPRNIEEKITIPPVKVAKFKAGKNLKDSLKS